jgi:hypothetical protein
MHLQDKNCIREQHPRCKVRFRTFIPIDLEKDPYVIWYSRGVHNHPPPPPTRAPYEVVEDIKILIGRLQRPDLTFCELTTSYLLIFN